MSQLPTVPDTLHETLWHGDQAAPMKSAAQVVAVLGREFSLELLQAIASQSEDDVGAAIERLLGAGLLFRSSHAAEQLHLQTRARSS
jgi:hypothetical protein